MAIEEPKVAPVAHLVPLKEIKLAKWNPINRVSERRLIDLRLSMDDMGLLYPLLIDTQKNLIDGHRRYAVAKSFGWKRISCLTIDNPFEHSYGSVQLTQQKLTGNDQIGVYLENPNALTGRQRDRLESVETKFGRWALVLLYKSNQGPGTYANACSAWRLLKGAVRLEELFRWIVKHQMTMVHVLLKGGIPAKTVLKAIKADRSIMIDET